MSKKFDELMAFLDAAIPLPATVEVCCRGCGARDRDVQLDAAGDTSPRGDFPYRCPDCGTRFSHDGYSPS